MVYFFCFCLAARLYNFNILFTICRGIEASSTYLLSWRLHMLFVLFDHLFVSTLVPQPPLWWNAGWLSTPWATLQHVHSLTCFQSFPSSLFRHSVYIHSDSRSLCFCQLSSDFTVFYPSLHLISFFPLMFSTPSIGHSYISFSTYFIPSTYFYFFQLHYIKQIMSPPSCETGKREIHPATSEWPLGW